MACTATTLSVYINPLHPNRMTVSQEFSALQQPNGQTSCTAMSCLKFSSFVIKISFSHFVYKRLVRSLIVAKIIICID
jgi:hypothetical protein